MGIWGKDMKNKFLIGGSAIAVVVLVLASLSPVVGYNSIKSSVKDSPLFAVRTKRALNEDSDDLTCEYVGKGSKVDIPIVMYRNKNTLVPTIIDYLIEMDDEEYNEFIELIINFLQQNNMDEEKSTEVMMLLPLLRENPSLLKIKTFRKAEVLPYGPNTVYDPTFCRWQPFCYLSVLFSLVFWFFLWLNNFIYSLTFIPTTSCVGCCFETVLIGK